MQNNGHDCGVFVCRYAYNLFLMRNMKFTWAGSSTFRNSITNGAAFQFDMGDIARIRKELGMLIRKLSVIYLREHIVASLDEDIFDNNNTDWDVEDATNVLELRDFERDENLLERESSTWSSRSSYVSTSYATNSTS